MNLEFRKHYTLDIDQEALANRLVTDNFYDIISAIADKVSINRDVIKCHKHNSCDTYLTTSLKNIMEEGAKNLGTLKKATLNLWVYFTYIEEKLLNKNELEIWVCQSDMILNMNGTQFHMVDDPEELDVWEYNELTIQIVKHLQDSGIDSFIKAKCNVDSVTFNADIL